MKFKTVLLGTATLALMAAPAVAQDAPPPKKHHHHTATAPAPSSVDARIDQLEKEIHELKEEQAAAQAAPPPSDAVSDAQFEALQNQVYEQSAATKSGWWSNTKISGRFFWDITNIDATGNVKSAASTLYHSKSPQNGFNYDLKRAYLIVDHKFNDTYSANLTTDATYDSTTGASQLFIKKAYLTAAYSPMFTIKVGAADLPWVPFVEGIYGYRYVENVLIDRTKFGTSTDWGAHVLGTFDLGGPTIGYQVSALNGFGYKADPIGGGSNRSKGIDVEGRINLTWDGFVAAVGGYDGKLGKDVQNTQVHCDAVAGHDYDATCHTATRFDALLAYTDDQFRIGGEYYSATNYKNVTDSATGSTTVHGVLPFGTDKSNGYSAFASWKFDPMWSVFGRYDWVKPTEVLLYAGAPTARNQYYNFGISYSPIPALDFALVYKHDSMENGAFTDSEFSTFTCVAYGNPNVTHGTCNQGKYDEIGLFGQVNF
jgi:hypothetical protein